MLSVQNQQAIEELIISSGLLTKDKLLAAKAEAVTQNKSLLSLIAEQKLIDDENLVKIEAQTSGVPYVNLSDLTVSEDITKLLPREVAENYMAVPFGRTAGKLAVAMLDPTNVQAADFIARKTEQPVVTFMASKGSISHVLEQYRANVALPENKEPEEEGPKKQEDLKTLVQDAPITRALNAILENAVLSRASDVHIEPREHELKIRFRIDGIMQDTMTLPKTSEPAIISRIKILSNLKIDEHRVPQDGQFQIKTAGAEVDLRVAIAPITWGEQVVIRLLNKTQSLLTLEALGVRGRAYKLVEEGIHKPHGMILSTGPTGSGKSTTLYALVQKIKDSSINIVTLEDPVEYKIDGVNQIQINPEVGLTFANGLRSVLRQDPNVIMVGEIRDEETVELAIQSALTGHVVFSSLHTNSAAGVLPRLLDMGAEPFLIASTVNTVIGQRLVRRLCDKCHEEAQSSEIETAEIKATLEKVLPKTEAETKKVAEVLGYDSLPLASQNAYTVYKAKGCADCTSGYKGRLGIFEVFNLNDAMEKLLATRATSSEVQRQAQADGMLTMKQDGYLKALTGMTTLEEVGRVAADY